MMLAPKEFCTGCTACASICPSGVISMKEDQEGFLHPSVDSDHCDDCGLCEGVCPVLAGKSPVNSDTKVYAAMNLQDRERLTSTSGGVFVLLCKWILDQNGVVFGAAFDENWNVEHRGTERETEIAAFKTAKYTQSKMGDAFAQVKRYLSEDRYVLFSGTPCQVAGLQSFLGKQYEKLFLVDLICHGVPSPFVWQRYLKYRRKKDADNAEIVQVNFRNKETGWTGYSVYIEYTNGATYAAINRDDPYMRAFIGNLDLRQSCYHCSFKGIQRFSDFTLGDYWGVWNQEPDFHDDKGTSIVLVHSSKGEDLWRELSDQMKHKAIDEGRSLNENLSALRPSFLPAHRELFMKNYDREDFTELTEELLPKPAPAKEASLFRSVVGKAKRVLKKLC